MAISDADMIGAWKKVLTLFQLRSGEMPTRDGKVLDTVALAAE